MFHILCWSNPTFSKMILLRCHYDPIGPGPSQLESWGKKPMEFLHDPAFQGNSEVQSGWKTRYRSTWQFHTLRWCIPEDPWDWHIYLHLPYFTTKNREPSNVGKYTHSSHGSVMGMRSSGKCHLFHPAWHSGDALCQLGSSMPCGGGKHQWLDSRPNPTGHQPWMKTSTFKVPNGS